MTITMLEDMKRFTAELDAARAGRKEDWNRIRKESADSVRGFSESRKTSAKQTREDLMKYRQKILKESTEVRTQVRGWLTSRHKDRMRELEVRRKRRDVQLAALRNMNLAFKNEVATQISQIGERRVKVAAEMRATLNNDRSKIRKDVEERLEESHNARMELRQHFLDMHNEWIAVAGHPAVSNESSRHRPSSAGEAISDAGSTQKTVDEPKTEMNEVDLEESILKIINKASKGVDLKTVANIMGIKWRKTTRPVQELVTKGLVRKEGGIYYPT